MLDHFCDYDVIKIYEFEETLPLPPYLYTINAGPYKIYNHINTIPGSPP
jgi:aminopeptidase N